jgi:hypothetical protein
LNLNPAGGNVVLSANTYINNLAYPAQNADAATKEYVDNFATTGISYHQPVYAATITTLEVATSGTITYAQPNGVANGIGATLTTTGTYNLIDTANIQTVGRRVLVQNQGNAVQNGVYTYANTTAIVRSTDTDEYGADSTTAFSINDYFFVQSGNVNAGAAFIVSAPSGTITFGTSNITFAQFSSSQVYSANTAAGLTLVGTVFSTKVDSTTTAFDAGGNIIVKASANLTTPNIGAATGTSLSLTGNISATGGTFGSGNISTTGNIQGGNFVGAVAATTVSASGNVTANNGMFTNVVNVASHTGTLVSVTGNVNGGNLISAALVQGATVSSSGNVVTVGVAASGNISATANIQGGNISTAGNVNGANIVATTLSATANVVANNVLATTIVNSASFTGTTVSVSGNITGGNLNTTGTLSTSGNIAANNVIATTISNAASFTGGLVSVTGNITGGNISTAGNLTFSSTGQRILGDFTNGTQLNRTMIQTITANSNTLVNFIPNGTATIAAVNVLNNSDPTNASLGQIGAYSAVDVRISSGIFGTGTYLPMTFYTGGSERVRIDTSGIVSVTGSLSVAGNVTANNGMFTNIVNVASHTGTLVSVTGNVISNNVVATTIVNAASYTGTLVSVTGNVNGGNLISAALVQGATVSSSGNVIAVGVAASGNISATANVQGGNGVFTTIVSAASHTGTLVSVTGTVTAASVVGGVMSGNNLTLTSTTTGVAKINISDNSISNAATPLLQFGIVAGNGFSTPDAARIWASSIDTSHAILNFASYNGGAPSTAQMSIVNGNVGISNTLPTTTLGVTGTAYVSSNITGGNLISLALVQGATVSSSGNVIAVGVAASGNISATANVQGGNGVFTTIVSAASHTGTLVSVTGNINGGNLITTGIAQIQNNLIVNAPAVGEGGQLILAWGNTPNVTGQANSTWNLDVDSSNVYRTFYQNSAGATNVMISISPASNIVSFPSTAGISVSGNVNAGTNFFIGNGSALTGITASASFPLTSGTSNISAIASGNISINVGGTANVAVFATTGEFVTGLLSVSGNITGGNISATSHTGTVVSVTGNVNGGNLISAALVQGATVSSSGNVVTVGVAASGNISATANVQGGNGVFTTIVSAASHTGTIVSITGNITAAGGVFGSGNISTTGNIQGGNFVGAVAATTVSASGNVNGGNLISAALVQGATVSSSGNVVTVGVAASGNISATGNVQGGNGVFTNSVTGTVVSATGNITGGNVQGVNVVGTTAVYGGSVASTRAIIDSNGSFFSYYLAETTARIQMGRDIGVSGGAGVALGGSSYALWGTNDTAGTNMYWKLATTVSTVTTSPQMTLTSTGLSLTGVMSAAGNVNGGNITTAGRLAVGTTSPVAALVVAAANGGSFEFVPENLANSNWLQSYNRVSSIYTNLVYNALSHQFKNSGGNVLTIDSTGLVSASGNITGGNIAATSHTGSVVSVTGNVTAAGAVFGSGNVSTTGNVQAGFFVGNGSALTGIAASTPTSVVNGTTNFTLAASGNANITVAGTANVAVFSTTGVVIAGNVTANIANANVIQGLILNSTTINFSYTMPAGYNGSLVGPITINSSPGITVPDGQRLLIQ